MNPKFSLLTSPPEQEQQKQCFLVRSHDSTVVENQLLEQLGNVARAVNNRQLKQSTPTARAVRVFHSAYNCLKQSVYGLAP
ncbi:hypothetical protein WA026_010214 [Henosepilachna vigintioctopunctata]|uniref:Uncharacterized protein n=1 Tax=Henosepilachna vigintioctopunctata TaxID=420089 RepID=A0AAW1UI16_9CUCU